MSLRPALHLTSTAMSRGIAFTTLSGVQYRCTVDWPHVSMRRLTGPGQMAFVIGTDESTTVIFDDYIDGNTEILWKTERSKDMRAPRPI